MQNIASYFVLLAKRWWWLLLLGVFLCGGITFIVSKLTPPVYRANATLIVNFQTSPSPYDSISAGVAAVPTYAQLLQSPAVLNPVVERHPRMTLQQLSGMMTVTPQPDSQLIELDVDNVDPTVAMDLANEISDQFVQYVNPQLTVSVLPIYATLPTDPIRPKPSRDAGIGALVGLGLALALIFLFEWIDDRPTSPEEVQELLGIDTLAIMPRLSSKERQKSIEEIPALAEECNILCASLNTQQAMKPFKLLMITSCMAGEGKSTLAANLAIFLARTGKRVLLIDADFRRPALDQYFQLDNYDGLSKVLLELSSQMPVKVEGRPTEILSLRVLTTGKLPPNPAELLQSPALRKLIEHLKSVPYFDYVIFDTPPLLPVADTQILASYIPTTILVVDASRTSRKMMVRVRRLLGKTRTTLLGVVINKSQWPRAGAINEYLNNVWHPKTAVSKTDTEMITPPETPPGNGMEMMMPPETPSTNGMDATIPETPSDKKIEQDITIVIPRPMKVKGERL